MILRTVSHQKVSSPHNWFAWRPVWAEEKTDSGVDYRLVWLTKVKRVVLRVSSARFVKYEL